jgi:hypothetical protein
LEPTIDHLREVCKECGVEVGVWFTDSDIWNLLDTPGILCPNCFMQLIEARGFATTGWKIVPEERITTAEIEVSRLNAELAAVDEALARRPAVSAAPNRVVAIYSGFDMASRADKAEAMEKHWKFHYDKTLTEKKALEWKEITDTDKPKVGDEVAEYIFATVDEPDYWIVSEVDHDGGWSSVATHFRPINPPAIPRRILGT